jgi:hypothetical protein
VNELKHTTGPFHVSGKGRNLHIGSMHSPMTLASLNSVHVDTPANALLFSASWDLLETLRELLTCVELENTDGVDEERIAAAQDAARAAIAKATGSQS